MGGQVHAHRWVSTCPPVGKKLADMIAQPPAKPDAKAEEFWRHLTPAEEDRRPGVWLGGFRWFKSPNVIRLEDYRDPAAMGRIRKALLRPHRGSSKDE